MASQKSSPESVVARSPRTGAVAAFIKSQPADATADAVVEAGKAAGHSIAANYVYKVRADARKEKPAKTARTRTDAMAARAERALAKLAQKRGGDDARAARGPRAAETQRASRSAEPIVAGGAEAQLAGLIVQVGTARAEVILARVKEVLSKLTF